jgi:hypothetical protein
MSDARDQVYSFVNLLAKLSRQAVSRNPQNDAAYLAIEGGSDEDLRLHGLLNWVEDDRAHAEAEKLRAQAEKMLKPSMAGADLLMAMHAADVYLNAARTIDPYEMRNGQTVRKSDGRTVTVDAAAAASCPGYETSPNLCRCPCYGCRHHCGAHNLDNV